MSTTSDQTLQVSEYLDLSLYEKARKFYKGRLWNYFIIVQQSMISFFMVNGVIFIIMDLSYSNITRTNFYMVDCAILSLQVFDILQRLALTKLKSCKKPGFVVDITVFQGCVTFILIELACNKEQNLTAAILFFIARILLQILRIGWIVKQLRNKKISNNSIQEDPAVSIEKQMNKSETYEGSYSQNFSEIELSDISKSMIKDVSDINISMNRRYNMDTVKEIIF